MPEWFMRHHTFSPKKAAQFHLKIHFGKLIAFYVAFSYSPMNTLISFDTGIVYATSLPHY